MDPTDQEFMVTGYVNENYYGVSGSYYVYGGDRYVTFQTDPYTRWVDLDNDGWYDYGVRDAGNGRWTRFDGFTWDENHPVPVGNGGPGQDERQPEGAWAELWERRISVWQCPV